MRDIVPVQDPLFRIIEIRGRSERPITDQDNDMKKPNASVSGTEKEKILIALRKARTSLGKIEAMVEEERDCFPVIQQVLAAIGLLKSANLLMLDRHIARELDGVAKADALRDELVRIVKTAQSK